jgi:hypothetical protein
MSDFDRRFNNMLLKRSTLGGFVPPQPSFTELKNKSRSTAFAADWPMPSGTIDVRAPVRIITGSPFSSFGPSSTRSIKSRRSSILLAQQLLILPV